MAETIFISEYLGKMDRGRSVVRQLQEFCKRGKFNIREIPCNRNEWCRDYMPVKAANGNLVLFTYFPLYLINSRKGRASIPDQKKICDEMRLSYEPSDIILDGGAIEVLDKRGIISDRFLSQNDDPEKAKEKIKELLGLKSLIVIPADPWDFTGHVDGLVRFIDPDTVLINDYAQMDKLIADESKYIRNKYTNWKKEFLTVFSREGLRIETLPSGFHLNTKVSSARGIYLNFLLLQDLIIMPTFVELEKENDEAAMKLEQLYKREVLLVEADQIAKEGGVINCITWNY